MLYEFLDSNIFMSLVTLLVGAFAIWLYLKARWDRKRDAANIILLEIQGAERKIKAGKSATSDPDKFSDYGPLMKDESWSKNKYLFVKDFDRDEWDSINDFYEKCSQYDESITHGSLSFSKNEEQIRINVHRIFADYIFETIERISKADKEVESEAIAKMGKEKAEAFETLYLNSDGSFISRPIYTPQKYADDRDRFLTIIEPDLSSKSVGMKLKKIAKVRSS